MLPKKKGLNEASMDMSPMIDMTFQLIAFFMVLVNFTDADQNQRVRLPRSELAKPPETAIKNAITLQIAPATRNSKANVIIIGADEAPSPQALKPYLTREVNLLRARHVEPKDATVIIRADSNAKTGFIQHVIKVCQEVKLEKFALRAQEDTGG